MQFARQWVGAVSYTGMFGAIGGRGLRRRTITADGAVLDQARADYARFLAAVIEAALDQSRRTGRPFEDLEKAVRRAVAGYIGDIASIIRPDDGTGSLSPGSPPRWKPTAPAAASGCRAPSYPPASARWTQALPRYRRSRRAPAGSTG